MGNTYKDDHGHFTSKENDGGACPHDGNGGGSRKTADAGKALKEDTDYEKDLMADDEISLDKKKRIWDLWDKSSEYMQKDMDAENIEKFNAANEEFADEVTLLFDPDKNPDKVDEFYEIMDAAKSPDDIEEFLRENIGERPEKWEVELDNAMHTPDFDEERSYGPDELSSELKDSFTDDFMKILRRKAQDMATNDRELATIWGMNDKAIVNLLADPDEGIGPDEIRKLAKEHDGVDKDRFRQLVEGGNKSMFDLGKGSDGRTVTSDDSDYGSGAEKGTDALYSNLVRESENGTVAYGEAKYYITNEGPGLSERLSEPYEDLSRKDQYIKWTLNKSAMPSTRKMKLYRTDSTNWLGDAKEGDVKDMRFLVNASLNDMTIKENEGKVKQRVHINIKPGDPILAINNDNEKEVDVINKNERYAFKIMSKSVGSDGIPTYEVELTEKK